MQVEAAFHGVFGPYAGWAHNTLFIGELASVQASLPEHLRAAAGGKKRGSGKASSKAAAPNGGKHGAAAAGGRASKAAADDQAGALDGGNGVAGKQQNEGHQAAGQDASAGVEAVGPGAIMGTFRVVKRARQAKRQPKD